MKKKLSEFWSGIVLHFKIMFKICICKEDELFVNPECSAEEHKAGGKQ